MKLKINDIDKIEVLFVSLTIGHGQYPYVMNNVHGIFSKKIFHKTNKTLKSLKNSRVKYFNRLRRLFLEKLVF